MITNTELMTLLPCPFCGAAPTLESSGDNCVGAISYDSPACKDCGFQLSNPSDWNRRAATAPEVPERVNWSNAPLGLSMLERDAWAVGYNHCRMDMLIPVDEAPSDRMRVQDQHAGSTTLS